MLYSLIPCGGGGDAAGGISPLYETLLVLVVQYLEAFNIKVASKLHDHEFRTWA